MTAGSDSDDILTVTRVAKQLRAYADVLESALPLLARDDVELLFSDKERIAQALSELHPDVDDALTTAFAMPLVEPLLPYSSEDEDTEGTEDTDAEGSDCEEGAETSCGTSTSSCSSAAPEAVMAKRMERFGLITMGVCVASSVVTATMVATLVAVFVALHQ